MATLFASGTATGSAAVSASAAVAQLLSGTASGTGTLSIPPKLASGALLGSSTVTGAIQVIRTVSGLLQSTGTLSLLGVPNTVYGTSSLTGELVVERAPVTVCGCTVSRPVTTYTCACGGTISVVTPVCVCSGSGAGGSGSGVLRWHQFFQPNDLSLFLRESTGEVVPASVSYTLFWYRNGVPVQAGPSNRVPGHGPSLGQFYVTGKVGEYGQPGDWLVRWRYQRFFFSEINEVELRFVIQDAVAAADSRDVTPRVLKYGWD